jgi:hypothetical protein
VRHRAASIVRHQSCGRLHRACVLAGCWLAPQNRGFGLLLLLQS